MKEDLQKVKDLLIARGCSQRTISNYISCIRRFKNYYNGKEDLKKFNESLAPFKNKIKEFINRYKNQMSDLSIKEASKYVKEGGTLVYAVPTLNIKESYNIVRLFLEENKEFELEKEELIFPYTYQTTGMYYAKIIKKTKIMRR